MSNLVYMKPICKNIDGSFEYELYFSDNTESVWGEFWDVDNPSSNGNMTPDEATYSEIYKLITNLPLKTFQETTCYSMEYATYRIFALAWIDIENLDEYPEKGRMVLYFGDTLDKVKEKISLYDLELEKK